MSVVCVVIACWCLGCGLIDLFVVYAWLLVFCCWFCLCGDVVLGVRLIYYVVFVLQWCLLTIPYVISVEVLVIMWRCGLVVGI